MSLTFWKRNWPGWSWLAGSLVCCAGAFLLNARAWRAGYEADLLWLYACYFLSLPLLFIAWCLFVAPFAPTDLEGASRQPGSAVLPVLGFGVAFAGACCVISHDLWFIVLPLVTLVLLGLISSARLRQEPAWKAIALRGTLSAILFILTWYECATTTVRFLDGLGARIEATCGSERLLVWAKEMIAAGPPGSQQMLNRDDLPEFILQLTNSSGPPWPTVRVWRGERATVSIIWGSGHGYAIGICPALAEPDGETASPEQRLRRAGIGLGMVYK
jgi:hypothetical protein